MQLIKRIYKKYVTRNSPDPHPVIEVNDKKVVFVHILKTAGTSVINAIGQNFKLHLPASEIIRRIGRESFENSYSFAFVRNPYEKVYSHYKYNIKTNQFNMKTHPIDFNLWVKKCFGTEKDYFYYHRQIQYTDQITWLIDDDNQICVNFIGRFESLNEDFRIIQKKLNIKKALPNLNKTSSEDYRKFYNQESINTISKVFKRDIDHFKYKF